MNLNSKFYAHKIAFWARKVIGSFEKRAPGLGASHAGIKVNEALCVRVPIINHGAGAWSRSGALSFRQKRLGFLTASGGELNRNFYWPVPEIPGKRTISPGIINLDTVPLISRVRFRCSGRPNVNDPHSVWHQI